MTTYFETIDTTHKAYLFGYALNDIKLPDILYSVSKIDIDNILNYRLHRKNENFIFPKINDELIKYVLYGFIELNNSHITYFNTKLIYLIDIEYKFIINIESFEDNIIDIENFKDNIIYSNNKTKFIISLFDKILIPYEINILKNNI